MSKNFYAIKKGLTPGIYTDWEEAKAQVHGYPGAVYKGFDTKEEAEAYLEDAQPDTSNPTGKEKKAARPSFDLPREPYAFTDGSFNVKTAVYGYGGFLICEGKEYVLQGSGADADMAAHRNVSGEVFGAMAAITKAKELGIKALTICYDYEGVKQWALPVEKGWKANNPLSRGYRAFVRDCGVTLSFVHTKGHTGIPGNERADRLAKEAVGL